MDKALILTIFDNLNYGNRLQNYAMQHTLKKYNLDVYTLNNISLCGNKPTLIARARKITLKKIIGKARKIILKPLNKEKFKVFKTFSDKYIKQSVANSYEGINKDFPLLCIGSDQIWNPYFFNDFNYSFGKFHQNSFSYAASFGVSEIPEEYKDDIKEALLKIKNISVREDSGAKIVEELIARKPEVVVDPTLLLTAEEWDEVIEEPKNLAKKKYILTYFLGKYSKQRRKYIKDFAKKNDFEIVDLGQPRAKKYYCAGPGEFLFFIKNCEMFITDSFHGAVFSIIYKRPFYVMNREDENKSMNSRIETLLGKFNLKDRMIENYSKELDLHCGLKDVDSILKMEREKSKTFLENAILNLNN